ncbi:hypothetical protein LSAT2_022826 [Lamellibrachia satsuma]|nr:hypothetical protein LSAT2_022826 [Lamellibrachia satsuma]
MPQNMTQKLVVRFQTLNRTQRVNYLPPAKVMEHKTLDAAETSSSSNSRPSRDERKQTQKAGNNTKEKERCYSPTK